MSDDAHKTVISASSLAALLGSDGLCIVDCRSDLKDPAKGRSDFVKSHIAGAVFADLDTELAAPIGPDTGRHPLPEPERFRRALCRLGVSGSSQVVAYDGGNGGLAARLWWMLRWMGHDRVAVLDGGFQRWTQAGLPTAVGASEAESGDFSGEPREGMTVTTAKLARAISAGEGMQLVDARDARRFYGEVEPIDTVAGHIPGALNRPFSRNLDADGLWRDAATLRSDWLTLSELDPSKPWAVMCGSGVTACHHALSAEIAGLPAPRLYAGSWSEWIRDPDRPVERR